MLRTIFWMRNSFMGFALLSADSAMVIDGGLLLLEIFVDVEVEPELFVNLKTLWARLTLIS
jgi:hypothetical protein